MAVQKIKVSREKLIQRVKDVQESDVAKYDAALSAYPDALKDYDKTVIGVVRDLASKVKFDVTCRDRVEGPRGSYDGYVKIPFLGEFPVKPKEPVYPNAHATVLRQLEMSAEETLTVEVNGSYRNYL